MQSVDAYLTVWSYMTMYYELHEHLQNLKPMRYMHALHKLALCEITNLFFYIIYIKLFNLVQISVMLFHEVLMCICSAK